MTLFRTIHASAHDIPLPDGSVQMICTSPPYWSLRKYSGEQAVAWPAVTYAPMPGLPPVTVAGCDPNCEHEWTSYLHPGQSGGTASAKVQIKGQDNFQIVPPTEQAYCAKCGGWRGDLGLEPDPVAYVGHLILCLREWRRILRDDGTCWVNLGDSYNSNASNQNGTSGDMVRPSREGAFTALGRRNKRIDSLKPKDLVGIPWRFAFAAQADGFYLRSDVIWAKPNPMPESVTDRPTKAHEYLFLLTKAQTYFWDGEAVKEAAAYGENRATFRGGGTYTNNNSFHNSTPVNGDGEIRERPETTSRNLRSVWTIPTAPFPGSHFATFPPKLVEPCIRAGSSERGACPHCGAPWRRVVERSRYEPEVVPVGVRFVDDSRSDKTRKLSGKEYNESVKVLGESWQPSCTCPAADPVPCVVCDPFHGSGTTGVVALRLGRQYVGVDISQDYLQGVTAERIGGGVQIGLGV